MFESHPDVVKLLTLWVGHLPSSSLRVPTQSVVVFNFNEIKTISIVYFTFQVWHVNVCSQVSSE